MRRWFWILLVGLACVFPSWSQEARRLQVLTTLPPLYSWVASVVGDRADVVNLLPPNVGPHDYQFRPKDLRKIQKADLILLNGLELESWFARAISANNDGARRKIIEVAAGLPTNSLIYELPELQVEPGGSHAHEHEHAHAGLANPHLWLDPILASHAVSNLLTALQQADPANASVYASNAATYQLRLHKLDQELRQAISKIPRREVVTFHDAFPYFCRRYDLKLVGVIEEVPGASPSARYLAALSKAIRDQKVGALFVEPQSEIRLARQLAKDLDIRLAILDTLETGRLEPDAYETGMRANLKSLQQALK